MQTSSLQRTAVTIATAILLLAGVGLSVAAGTTLKGDPPGPIVSDRPIEAVVEATVETTVAPVPAPAPKPEPAPIPPVAERSAPAPRWNAAPPEPDKPKAEVKKPVADKDEDDEDDEDHETVKPPVRDEEEDDEHDVIDEPDGDVKD